jgi:hypothetical protein
MGDLEGKQNALSLYINEINRDMVHGATKFLEKVNPRLAAGVGYHASCLGSSVSEKML